MTKREFLNAVVDANLSEEMSAFAKKEIASLDKRNATPSKAEKEKRAENEKLKVAIAAVLADGTVRVASEIASTVGMTTSKASALLRQMSEAGAVAVSEVKIKGKGKVKGYALVTTEADSE